MQACGGARQAVGIALGCRRIPPLGQALCQPGPGRPSGRQGEAGHFPGPHQKACSRAGNVACITREISLDLILTRPCVLGLRPRLRRLPVCPARLLDGGG